MIYPKAGVNILSISIAEEINTDSPNYHIYLWGAGDLYSNHGTLRFLAGDHKVIDITQIEDVPPIAEDGKGITVLATYTNFEPFAEIVSLYPQGKLSDEYHDGYLEFKKFQIPPLK